VEQPQPHWQISLKNFPKVEDENGGNGKHVGLKKDRYDVGFAENVPDAVNAEMMMDNGAPCCDAD
jgi:hypothetical protein